MLHALVMDALWRTIGDPHPHGGEGGRQRPFGSFTPADASPLCGGENVFSRRGELIGDMALARPPASGDRKHKPDIARIDFLLLGDSAAHFRPRASSPWRNGRTGHRLHPPAPSQTERQRRGIDLGQRNLRLRTRRPPGLGRAGLCLPLGGAGPAFRQKQARPIITGISSRASVSDTSV